MLGVAVRDVTGDPVIDKGLASGAIYTNAELQFEADMMQSFAELERLLANPTATGKLLSVPVGEAVALIASRGGYDKRPDRRPGPLVVERGLEQVAQQLYRLIDEEDRRRLVLDFEKVQYLSSQAIGILLACCMFWGLQQILVKAIVHEVAPLFQASLRCIGACVLLMLWCRWRGVKLFERDGSLWAGLLAGALFALQVVCTLFISAKTADMVIVYSGDGLGMVLGVLLMSTFFVRQLRTNTGQSLLHSWSPLVDWGIDSQV